MANRVLRDWTFSENVDSLSYEAEVFFTRLIMKADDFGRFHASPKLLKAALFPLRENINLEDIISMVEQCAKSGIIKLYSSGEKQYIQIPEFNQRLRVMSSKFPEPQTFDNFARSSAGESRPERKKETEDETETEKKETASAVPALSKFDFKKALLSFGFNSDLVNEWMQVRKVKRAVNSETSFNMFINEILKAPSIDKNEILKICVGNSWKGFKAEWLQNINQNNYGNNTNNQQPTAGGADQKISDYTKHVLSSIGGQNGGSETKPNNEDGSHDFAEFQFVQE